MHVLDEASQACPKCGEHQPEWDSQFEESHEVHIKPGSTLCAVACARSTSAAAATSRQRSARTSLQAGGKYSNDFAAGIAFDKYLVGRH